MDAEKLIEAAWTEHVRLYPFAEKLTFIFGARAGLYVASQIMDQSIPDPSEPVDVVEARV